MIEYKEEYTDEPNYSLGRRGKSEREIWDIEDNGGFKKVTVNGNVENVSRYTKESVKNAVKEYQNLIKSGESIAVLNMDNGVEIIKPATTLKYECDHCGCVFRIKQYLCDWTELYPKIFDYTAKCPECKRVCTNYDDEV